MNYKNGYKVVYEVAANGQRTFYATKSNVYPAEGDKLLATFTDADFAGKTIYEYRGEFYVSTGAVPAYNADGTPKDSKIAGFDELFVEKTEGEAEGEAAGHEDEEPVAINEDEPSDGDDGDDEGVPDEDEPAVE